MGFLRAVSGKDRCWRGRHSHWSESNRKIFELFKARLQLVFWVRCRKDIYHKFVLILTDFWNGLASILNKWFIPSLIIRTNKAQAIFLKLYVNFQPATGPYWQPWFWNLHMYMHRPKAPNDQMFPNTPEVSEMVFSVLLKPVWLIWSCPNN